MTNLLAIAMSLAFLARQETRGEADPRNAVGDGGRALGRYQMHAAAVADVNRRFKPVAPYTLADRSHPVRGELLATGYVIVLQERALAKLGRRLTDQELGAAWRRGWAGWYRRKLEGTRK
jgi:hypothetical protein